MLSQRSSHHRRLSQTSRLAHSMLEWQGFHGFVRPHVPGRVNTARSGGRPLALIRYPQRNNRCMCEMLNNEWNSEVALYASLHFVVYEDEEARPSWPTTPLSPC